jgi:Domain of unknown function (DUF4160)
VNLRDTAHHPPPHSHARYGEHVSQIELNNWLILNGSLPSRGLRARVAGDQAVAGRLEIRVRADVIALAADPVKADPDELPDVRVRYTVVDGDVAFAAASTWSPTHQKTFETIDD